jgi:SpoIID/LytB domain protein
MKGWQFTSCRCRAPLKVQLPGSDTTKVSELSLSRRHFVILAAGSVLSACTTPSPRVPESARMALPPRIAVRRGGRIEMIALDDYVLGSTLAEVSPVNETAATAARVFEVQAVLARSFAVAHPGRHRAEGFDLCDTSHCQIYDPARIRTSRFANAARAAVQGTTGVVLTYRQRPAAALFHADCGGHTAGADSIWGGTAVPYLRPAPDTLRAAAHRSWQIAVPVERLRELLNADERSRVGTKLRGIEVRRRDVSGRALTMAVIGAEPKTVRGEDFRSILNRRLGERAILSTRFEVRQANGTYIFQGTGFGHGVGLCQVGAAARARRGESLEQILATYFQGASVSEVKGA